MRGFIEHPKTVRKPLGAFAAMTAVGLSVTVMGGFGGLQLGVLLGIVIVIVIVGIGLQTFYAVRSFNK